MATVQDSNEALESAGGLVDKYQVSDRRFYDLSGLLRVTSDRVTNGSGQSDVDYPFLSSLFPSLDGMPLIGDVDHTPLPSELVQEFESEVQVLGRAIRSEIVNSLYTRMLQHTQSPNCGEYNAVCDLLVKKFPILKDDANATCPYNTWKMQLRWKFKNGRRGQTTHTESRSKKRNLEGTIDEEDYEMHIVTLKKEWDQKNRRHSKIQEIMIKTFVNRHNWITDPNHQPAVTEVLAKFPCLDTANYLEQELKLILGIEDSNFMIEWSMWRDKIFAYVDTEKKSQSRLKRIQGFYISDKERLQLVDDTTDDLRDFYTLLFLQSILLYRGDTKQFIYTFSDTIDNEDAIKNIKISQPCLVRFISDFGHPTYHIVVESRMTETIATAKNALIALMAAYYTFDVKYPSIQSSTLIFIQHCIMNIDYKTKLPQSVAMLKSNISKIVL